MSCNMEAELTAYVDEELGPAETLDLRAHLLGCADCRSTEALLRRTVQTLAALPAFEPSLGLRRTVLTQVEATPARLGERLGRWLRPRGSDRRESSHAARSPDGRSPGRARDPERSPGPRSAAWCMSRLPD